VKNLFVFLIVFLENSFLLTEMWKEDILTAIQETV